MAVMIQIITVIATIAFLLTVTSANKFKETGYALTVGSRLKGGQDETLCVHIVSPSDRICLKIDLNVPGYQKIIIMERNIRRDYYHCFKFQAPRVDREKVGEVTLILEDKKDEMKATTKVLVVPTGCTPVTQSVKPVYKPGETVKFRIAVLDENFLTCYGKFETVRLQDPKSNIIEQWVGQDFSVGIMEFSYELSSQALKGTYKILLVTDERREYNSKFAVDEYVLPKYKVTVQTPSVVSILDDQISFRVCGRYTYGKPVIGSIRAVFCRKDYYYWFFRPGNNLCETFQMTTNKSGCATQQVDMTKYFQGSIWSINNFELTADLTETSTGLNQSGSASMEFTRTVLRAEFIEIPRGYSNGLPFEGKVKITGPDGQPVPEAVVTVQDRYSQRLRRTTNSNGVASFSLKTHRWRRDRETVTAIPERRTVQRNFYHRAWYQNDYRIAYKYYSPSGSSVKIRQVPGEISCEEDPAVNVDYIVQSAALKAGQETLSFFFLVVSRGQIVIDGFVPVTVNSKTENRGTFKVYLDQDTNLAPHAQVVVYTFLRSREVLSDSRDFSIQLCFKNKVSVEFSSPQYFPGRTASLNLQAEPLSLCSLRAIDQSALLLADEEKITVERIFDQLPVKKIQYYDYRIRDPEPNPCEQVPTPRPAPPFGGVGPPGPAPPPPRVFRSYRVIRDQGENSAKQFEAVGVKIATNYNLKKPPRCEEVYYPNHYYNYPAGPPSRMPEMGPPPPPLPTDASRQSDVTEETIRTTRTIRTDFPEYWIWNLISVGKDGSVDLQQTIPDTITSWVADAFCVSPVGFGLAKGSETTTFKSFFVSLALPFSVIRGEAFTLKATVFNYESKCLRLQITLANSDKYDFRNCMDCQYQACLCAEDSLTFSWIVTPKNIGLVNVSVTAEAMQDGDVCGEKPTTVPEEGRIDTVIRSLLVEPEGIPKMAGVNSLICSKNNTVNKIISLGVPSDTVEGSIKGFVTVIGDLLGSALNNLEDLLRMPYGCGEQTMLSYAPNVVFIEYLDSTGQLTLEIKKKAVTFMKTGYAKILQYRHREGGFSAFGERDRSAETWLTAFVLKTISNSQPYISVDQNIITDAAVWLSYQRNETTGCFRSVGKLYHNSMKGGVSDDVTLTAYIIAAMLEGTYEPTDLGVQEGLRCLRDAFHSNIDNLYTIALMSYTFSLAGDEDMRETLLQQLHDESIEQGGTRYLPRPGARQPDSLEVEMTSYFLMAILCDPPLPDYDIGYASVIVRWLITQMNPRGGFSSTQDTVVGIQALGKYASDTYTIGSLRSNRVTVTTPNGGKIKFSVNQNNKLVYQEEPLDDDNVLGEHNVEVDGHGCILVQLSVYYNIPPPPESFIFHISTNVLGHCDTNPPAFDLSVAVSFLGPRNVTNMVVVDIKLLSGHSPDRTSLNLLEGYPGVKKVEHTNGHVFIYIDELMKDVKQKYELTLQQDDRVENLKPASVEVYDYYQTSDEASTNYTTPCVSPPPPTSPMPL